MRTAMFLPANSPATVKLAGQLSMVAVIAGLGAGCVGGIPFREPMFTGSTANQQRIMSGQRRASVSRRTDPRASRRTTCRRCPARRADLPPPLGMRRALIRRPAPTRAAAMPTPIGQVAAAPRVRAWRAADDARRAGGAHRRTAPPLRRRLACRAARRHDVEHLAALSRAGRAADGGEWRLDQHPHRPEPGHSGRRRQRRPRHSRTCNSRASTRPSADRHLPSPRPPRHPSLQPGVAAGCRNPACAARRHRSRRQRRRRRRQRGARRRLRQRAPRRASAGRCAAASSPASADARRRAQRRHQSLGAGRHRSPGRRGRHRDLCRQRAEELRQPRPDPPYRRLGLGLRPQQRAAR